MPKFPTFGGTTITASLPRESKDDVVTTSINTIATAPTTVATGSATGPTTIGSQRQHAFDSTVTTSKANVIGDDGVDIGATNIIPFSSVDLNKIRLPTLPPVNISNQNNPQNNSSNARAAQTYDNGRNISTSKYNSLDYDMEAALAQSRLEHQQALASGYGNVNTNINNKHNNNNNNNNSNRNNGVSNKSNKIANYDNDLSSIAHISDNLGNLSLNNKPSLAQILIDECKIIDITDDLSPAPRMHDINNIFNNFWEARFNRYVSSSVYINEMINRANKGDTAYMSLRHNHRNGKFIGANNLIIFGGGFKIDADTFGVSDVEKQWWTNSNWAKVGGVFPSGRFLQRVPTFEEAKHQFPGCSDGVCREAIKKFNFMRSHVQDFAYIPHYQLPINKHKLPEQDSLTRIIRIPNYSYREYNSEEIDQFFQLTSRRNREQQHQSNRLIIDPNKAGDKFVNNNVTSVVSGSLQRFGSDIEAPEQLGFDIVETQSLKSISNNCLINDESQNVGVDLSQGNVGTPQSPGTLQPTAAIRRRLLRNITGEQRFENMDNQPSRQNKNNNITNVTNTKNIKDMKTTNDKNKKRTRKTFENIKASQNVSNISNLTMISSTANISLPPSISTLTQSSIQSNLSVRAANNSNSKKKALICQDPVCNCRQSFKSRNGLKDHIQTVKNRSQGISFYCPHADCAVYKYLIKSIKQHVPSHHEPFECLFCHQKFSQKIHCEKHIKSRHDDRFENVNHANYKKHIKVIDLDYAKIYPNSFWG